VVSIVIVNWNSGEFLERCVRSLLKNAAGSEIVIVDNDSSDSSLRFAEDVQNLKVLHNSSNLGFAAANNIGWRAAIGARVLFLNPDTECFPESVNRLEQTLAADNGIWAAGGQLVSLSGQPQTRYSARFPSSGSVAAEMLFIDEIWPSNPWSAPIRPDSSVREMDVDQPAAACLMVSRKALEKIEGFDEEFRPAWFEDVDLCRRIRNQGGRIRFQPQALFLHHGGYSLQQLSRQEFLESFYRNQIRYFHKHHGSHAARRVQRLISMGLFIRSAVSMIHSLAPGESRTASAGIFWRAARRISRSQKAAS